MWTKLGTKVSQSQYSLMISNKRT